MARKSRPWYRREDSWWMTCIGGKQVKLIHGPKDQQTKKQATEKLDELLDLELIRGKSDDRLTVAGTIGLYLDHAKHLYASRSYYERRRILQRFAEAHGWRLVNDRDCLPFHLESWVDEHRDRWKSDWTVGAVINTVQRPFNWAAKKRLIPANPFRGVSHWTGAPRRPMTDEEFDALVEAAVGGRRTKMGPSPGERFAELLRFLRLTGMRPGEASKLKWTDIHWSANLIVLKKHKTARMQKKPKPRNVPMTEAIVEMLEAIKGREEGELVFYTYRRTPWNRSNMSLRMQRARKKSGVPDDAKLYGLRHRFGTQCIIRGVDIKTTSELLGHTTTRMTEHYLHLAGEKSHLARAMRLASS